MIGHLLQIIIGDQNSREKASNTTPNTERMMAINFPKKTINQ